MMKTHIRLHTTQQLYGKHNTKIHCKKKGEKIKYIYTCT